MVVIPLPLIERENIDYMVRKRRSSRFLVVVGAVVCLWFWKGWVNVIQIVLVYCEVFVGCDNDDDYDDYDDDEDDEWRME